MLLSSIGPRSVPKISFASRSGLTLSQAFLRPAPPHRRLGSDAVVGHIETAENEGVLFFNSTFESSLEVNEENHKMRTNAL